ncbi:SDR family NAD(P)-dependent oxidoreductase [Longimicrobium sp.]|uniref:SDR family NAD(P)-dependent oxidoreductase n=1 Tax=Longimicrobium sp. TaxID=2029185 RepID=UPI002BF29369|nr:SDR family NAD(P)-dependent oxidoreductase [Longimicrobium sp.]HSU13266.1 SDR family NAD(P)-dependent oxidoreductase [Longimicrobium sp.]
MPSSEPGRDPEPQKPSAQYHPLQMEGLRVADPVEQLLEEVTEETQPQSLNYGSAMRGRVAIVTGGATGIGKAIALEFARHGVHVAFNWFQYDTRGDVGEEAEQTAREIKSLEVGVHHEECDVRDARAVDRFVGETVEKLGGVNILVNNAGIARDRALWRLTDEQWRSVLDTNLTGAFHLIRAVSPIYRRQHDGKIVNVSSVHGIRSEFGLANYSASKAGLLGLTRSAALELGPSNVNVNAVAPGYIRTTRLTSGVPAEILDTARERAVLGRLGDPQDVANVVVFLCSEYARHITGAVIPVDGGHLL